jgi:uncharacterized membrane protein YbhN (UPF0104 family)
MNQHRAPGSTINARNIIAALVVILILFFLIRFLYHHWREVATFDFTFNYYYLVISFTVLFIFFFLRVYCWKVILHKMNISLSLRKSIKVSFLSMMGRYLPGKVWMVLGKVYLSGKEGVPRAEAFASVVIEIVLEIVASIFFFFFFLFSLVEHSVLSPRVLYLLGIILVAGMVLLHPKLFYKVINTILSRLKRETIQEGITYKDILLLFLLYNGIVLIQGTAFYFFVNALCYVPLDNLLVLTGSLAVAGALGTLSFFSPSGLGVREGVLALLLSSSVVAPIAVLISLLARLWVTAGEVLCALFAWRL